MYALVKNSLGGLISNVGGQAPQAPPISSSDFGE